MTFADLDQDGDLDIYVANDTAPNLLLRNDGDWRFAEVGLDAGVAFSGTGKDQAGMGVHSGDYDNDGRPDLFVTNFSDDVNTLYRNEGNLRFADATFAAGLAGVVLPYLGWGTGFVDFDNDGWLDLFVANGHLYPQLENYSSGLRYAQRNLLYHNRAGRFAEVGLQTGQAWAIEKVSRAAAIGDYDNDGDADLLFLNLNDAPTLLRNERGNNNHWLGLKLVGTKSNRDAIGTRVQVVTGDLTLVREVQRGYGFQAGHDPRLLFGLGQNQRVERIDIRWPSGRRQVIENPPPRRYLNVREGSDQVAALQPPPTAAPGMLRPASQNQQTAASTRLPSSDQDRQTDPKPAPQIGAPHWDAEDYLQAGKTLYSKGRYDEVRTVLQQGLLQEPNSLPLRIHLGLVLILGLGNYAAAATELERAVQDYPQSVDAHYYLGRAYLGQNRLVAAIQALQQATELDPASWIYHKLVGPGLYARRQPRGRYGRPEKGRDPGPLGA